MEDNIYARRYKRNRDMVKQHTDELLSAVEDFHSHGVTHRGIKPANMMMYSHHSIHLIDYDLAGKAQWTDDIGGTTKYMSPIGFSFF